VSGDLYGDPYGTAYLYTKSYQIQNPARPQPRGASASDAYGFTSNASLILSKVLSNTQDFIKLANHQSRFFGEINSLMGTRSTDNTTIDNEEGQAFDSKHINCSQNGIHERLAEIVQKHKTTQFQKPYQSHNLEAFELLREKIRLQTHSSLILDSCCGTAMSTLILAERHPDSLVVGVDQSAARLSKVCDVDNQVRTLPDNCLLLRANCEDLWRLCVDHDIHFDSHYILYPNPWPKSVHVKRRWHGHSVMPYLPKIAERTILRSNWLLYLQEFSAAWQQLTGQASEPQQLNITTPLTLFERKYAGSGQALYELSVSLREL